jgi:dUTP pyrophosphatase
VTVAVRIQRLANAADLPLPECATEGSAGADLRSAEPGAVVLQPGQRRAVSTGFVVEIPDGYEGQIRPRSGLALRYGLTVVNAPGTIDADYRGEVKVLLVNLGESDVAIERGDRIAQLVIAPVTRVAFTESERLTETGRGSGGFGSTGT